jgi:hypothetical protein
MAAALQILVGLIINKIEEIHDYIQIVFSDGTTLSIFNNYHYDDGSVLFVKGKKIESVEEGEAKVVLTLEDGSCFSIGMSDEDYNGPEAIVLRHEGEPPVVWS